MKLNPLRTRSTYLPGKEVLHIEIDMSDYLIDYYLHRKAVAPDTDAAHSGVLRDLLACMAIHLTARPSEETHAWTANLVASPPYSIFVTGALTQLEDARKAEGYLVGNIVTENIAHTDINSFHAQRSAMSSGVSRSYIQSDDSEPAKIVQEFYDKSEQRPLRIFLPLDSDKAYAFAALPDFDEEWFKTTSLDGFAPDNSAVLLRSCEFVFNCGCSPEKLLPFFKTLSQAELDELYGKDQALFISCPRCGVVFEMSKEAFSGAD